MSEHSRMWLVTPEVVIEAESATEAAQEARRYLDTTVNDYPVTVRPYNIDLLRDQEIWTTSTIGEDGDATPSGEHPHDYGYYPEN